MRLQLLSTRHLPILSAIAIAGAMALLGSLRYEHFAAPATMTNLLSEYAFVGVAAVGATFVIISGGIDLSVGSMIAFTSTLIALLVQRGVHPLTAATIALLVGTSIGAAMGMIIQVFRLPAFIVTLAGMFALRALGFAVHDQSIGIRHDFYVRTSRDAVIALGDGASLPLRSMIMLAMLIAGIVIARYTGFGRNVYAMGGNPRSARLMGVPIAATTIAVYALNGFTAALAGFVFTLYKHAGDPASVVGLELDVIAAVVIGGTLLSGGVGGVGGTLIGLIILGLIRAILDFEGSLNAAWTSIATGGLILVFVTIQQLLGILGGRRARETLTAKAP